MKEKGTETKRIKGRINTGRQEEVKRLKKMIGDDVIWKLQDDGMKEDELRR